jgi:hypothetical protein
MEALGPYAQLQDFNGGRWVYGYLRSRGTTIAAGTSEILRNILAEQVLGLPKSYFKGQISLGPYASSSSRASPFKPCHFLHLTC